MSNISLAFEKNELIGTHKGILEKEDLGCSNNLSKVFTFLGNDKSVRYTPKLYELGGKTLGQSHNTYAHSVLYSPTGWLCDLG